MRQLLVIGSVAAVAFLGIPSLGYADAKVFDGVVNVNLAGVDDLVRLPGVGPAKARAIVEYREKHRFRTVAELARVKGIGRKTVLKLRPNLAVDGPAVRISAGRQTDPPPCREVGPADPAPPPSRAAARSAPAPASPPAPG